jgi:hypothetical protein
MLILTFVLALGTGAQSLPACFGYTLYVVYVLA